MLLFSQKAMNLWQKSQHTLVDVRTDENPQPPRSRPVEPGLLALRQKPSQDTYLAIGWLPVFRTFKRTEKAKILDGQ